MPLTARQANIHLLWRAGFGPSASQLQHLHTVSRQKLFHVLSSASEKIPEDYQVIDEALVSLATDRQALRKMTTSDERKMLRAKNRDSVKKLNLTWLADMVASDSQLREKAAFFWHGHFACRSNNAVHQQLLLNVIRRNALGNFRDILHQVSTTGAILNFLNNNQNRKDHPNENFAREVMELFTLGRGNYTETDIKEAARAFTGWGANPAGNFIFRKQLHDTGIKTVLGKTGNFNGDDVLNILLEQKQTARFIVQKLYRFFVNEQLDNEQVNQLADFFYNSNYDITALLTQLFTSSWFYDAANFGIKIKSPVELLAGIQRMLPIKIENQNTLLTVQRILGQVLLYPPNVAGWPGGKSWIDSSTLMMRMRLPGLMNDTDNLNVKPKDDDDQMMGRKDDETVAAPLKPSNKRNRTKLFNATINWEKYIQHFAAVPKAALIHAIAGVLLNTDSQLPDNLINQHVDVSSKENFIKSATIQIMSLPEYQLC